VARAQRLFYSRFVQRGDLVFDVGASFGARVATFLALGARVVAVEPQAACQDALRRRFARSKRFALVGSALGPAPGQAELRATAPGSTIATMSTDWLERVRDSGRFGGADWSLAETVEVQTLDALIAEFGAPVFCKIDVEGYEHEVLLGLTAPIAALSLEFTPEHMEATRKCVARLQSLGAYRFNYSLDESFLLALDEWVPGEQLLEALAAHADDRVVFGDVYAQLSG
jgi:FkbM family methyltransferase